MEELRNDLEKAVYQAILPVEDPELFISIMELGLIYDIKVNENNEANVKMTFTSMACPAGPSLKITGIICRAPSRRNQRCKR
jgi:metal-sulfur cluster biosynthetic enzyme